MSYKKNWFGWINFFLSAGLISVLLCSFFTLVFSLYVKNEFISNYSYLFAAFSVIILYGLFFLLNLIKSKISEKLSNAWKLFGKVITFIFFFVMTGIGVYFIVLSINNLINKAYVFEINNYYSDIINALVYNDKLPGCTSLVYICCSLISLIYKIFGFNSIIIGIIALVLTLISFIFIFFTVYNLYGKIPALFTYFFISAFTYFQVDFFKVMNGLTLFLFLISLISFLFSLILKSRSDGCMHSNSNIILFIFFGILYGLLIYLDPRALFCFGLFSYVLCTAANADADSSKFINRRAVPSICFIFTGLIVAIGAVVLEVYLSGQLPLDRIYYLYNNFLLSNLYSSILFSDYLVESIVVYSFCLFACLGFLTSKKADKYGSAFFATLILFITSAFNAKQSNYSGSIFLFLGLLVGCGVQEILVNSYNIENNVFSNELIIIGEETAVSPMDEAVTDVITETVTETAAGDVKTAVEFDKKAFIDNPLPLPKKHIKKSIEFPVEPSTDKMDYDIIVREDDDFDI